MRAVDLAAGLIIASVVVLCVGAVVLSAREAGRGAGRRIAQRTPIEPAPGPARARRSAAAPHRRSAGHPPPEVARRRERAASRPRRRD